MSNERGTILDVQGMTCPSCMRHVSSALKVGSAIGLAAMVAVAGSKSASLALEGVERTVAMSGGFSAAFIGAAVITFGAAALSTFAIRMPSAQPSTEASRLAA